MSELIVALDFETINEAMSIAYRLRDHVSIFKIGMELGFDNERERLITMLKDQNAKIFLDLKLQDIPKTIERTVRKISLDKRIDMLSVYGYPDTMFAAAQGAIDSNLQIYAVGSLTSNSDEKLKSAGYYGNAQSLIKQRTDYAVLAALTGMICSVEYVKHVKNCSKLKTISPGIRMKEDRTDDHQRAVSPRQASKEGADYFVVGRPITRNNNPVEAAERYLNA